MLGKHAIALQSTLRSARAAVVEQAKGRHESSAHFSVRTGHQGPLEKGADVSCGSLCIGVGRVSSPARRAIDESQPGRDPLFVRSAVRRRAVPEPCAADGEPMPAA